jgi:hypothetical protein
MAARSRPPSRPAPTFAAQAVALAWGAWVELGVSGWTATHGAWAIDPEPVIVLTAFLGDEDPRLRDEATDWCIRNWRHVSKARLKNLVRDQPAEVRSSFGELSATVAEHAGVMWPYPTTPRRYRPTGRSGAPQLDKPSMVWLRLRAMFGLGARTETLRFFLSESRTSASISTIASATSYTKRNVADECDALAQAGLLRVRTVGNRFTYSMAKRDELEALVGAMPPHRPDWTALADVARRLVELESQVATSSERTLAVKARAVLDELRSDLGELEIQGPGSDVRGADLWPSLQALGTRSLGAWSLGRWHR